MREAARDLSASLARHPTPAVQWTSSRRNPTAPISFAPREARRPRSSSSARCRREPIPRSCWLRPLQRPKPAPESLATVDRTEVRGQRWAALSTYPYIAYCTIAAVIFSDEARWC